MTERPRFFDDFAGVAGGAFSAFHGMREEFEAAVKARTDEFLSRLSLVRRDEFEAVQEMVANARAAQDTAEARLTGIEARLAAVEGRLAAAEARQAPPVSTTAVSSTHVPPPDGGVA